MALRLSYKLGSCALKLSCCGTYGAHARDPLGREMAGEGAAAAEFALHLERSAVALQHVLDDREPEARPAGRARAAGIDPVEALGEPWDVLGRNPHSRIRHREVAAVVIDPPAHLDRALGRGVLGG